MRTLKEKAAVLALVAFASCAFAQSWPMQPVRVVVGFPPGGTTDVVGRLVANELSEQLGKPFVVDNRGGASGTIAAGQVAKGAADGHTLLLVPSTHGTARALYASLPYEESDFAVCGLVASTPYVFVVHPDLPVKTFGELVALLKANPGKYNYASTSPGTSQHLGGELVKKLAGVDMVHVAYKGTGAVMPDLLSGRVPMMFENLAVMTPHIRKGTLRPLGVSSLKRTHLMPEVPTVAETGMGLEGFEVLGWFALLAPAKTPPQIVRGLNDELNKMVAKPAMVAKFAELGAEPLGGTPERAAAYMRAEQEKWGRVIREVGIKLN
ncbi:MAG TPA: tripartite tricarboxylate transporter substrate binding protein [Burkholderiales bacterium]|nr:tripartite tricarboxylate transporter substrate binding protein [Burkholderiales bacterium]